MVKHTLYTLKDKIFGGQNLPKIKKFQLFCPPKILACRNCASTFSQSFFMKLGDNVSGYVLSPTYKPSPIPEGGLEILLIVTFKHESEHILNQMKTFVNEKYDEIVEKSW